MLNDDQSYQIEYRAGSADQHYHTHLPAPTEMFGPERVAGLMLGWAHDRPGWRTTMEWALLPADQTMPDSGPAT
jgi:hypothetical protein